MKKEGLLERVIARSVWDFELIRDGKVIDRWSERNVVTNEGLSNMLEIMFRGDTQETTWYVGIYDNSYSPAITETYTTHTFTEFTDYSGSNRPTCQFAASGGATTINNSANKASFSITGSGTIYGAFLCSGATKGDSGSGEILYCVSNFSSAKSVESSDTLNVTVTLTLADS